MTMTEFPQHKSFDSHDDDDAMWVSLTIVEDGNEPHTIKGGLLSLQPTCIEICAAIDGFTVRIFYEDIVAVEAWPELRQLICHTGSEDSKASYRQYVCICEDRTIIPPLSDVIRAKVARIRNLPSQKNADVLQSGEHRRFRTPPRQHILNPQNTQQLDHTANSRAAVSTGQKRRFVLPTPRSDSTSVKRTRSPSGENEKLSSKPTNGTVRPQTQPVAPVEQRAASTSNPIYEAIESPPPPLWLLQRRPSECEQRHAILHGWNANNAAQERSNRLHQALYAAPPSTQPMRETPMVFSNATARSGNPIGNTWQSYRHFDPIVLQPQRSEPGPFHQNRNRSASPILSVESFCFTEPPPVIIKNGKAISQDRSSAAPVASSIADSPPRHAAPKSRPAPKSTPSRVEAQPQPTPVPQPAQSQSPPKQEAATTVPLPKQEAADSPGPEDEKLETPRSDSSEDETPRKKVSAAADPLSLYGPAPTSGKQGAPKAKRALDVVLTPTTPPATEPKKSEISTPQQGAPKKDVPFSQPQPLPKPAERSEPDPAAVSAPKAPASRPVEGKKLPPAVNNGEPAHSSSPASPVAGSPKKQPSSPSPNSSPKKMKVASSPMTPQPAEPVKSKLPPPPAGGPPKMAAGSGRPPPPAGYSSPAQTPRTGTPDSYHTSSPQPIAPQGRPPPPPARSGSAASSVGPSAPGSGAPPKMKLKKVIPSGDRSMSVSSLNSSASVGSAKGRPPPPPGYGR